MTKKRPNYTAEQKLEALKVVEKNNGNVSASARELGLPMQTLSNWYRGHKSAHTFNCTRSGISVKFNK